MNFDPSTTKTLYCVCLESTGEIVLNMLYSSYEESKAFIDNFENEMQLSSSYKKQIESEVKKMKQDLVIRKIVFYTLPII